MDMKQPIVLLAEDNLAEAELARQVFQTINPALTIHVAVDGVETLSFLRREGKHSTVPRPDLVLLDLNMPRMSGRDVLGKIKQDPELHSIPVVVLTCSNAESDIQRCYDLHANCFVTKSLDLQEFFESMTCIAALWLRQPRRPDYN